MTRPDAVLTDIEGTLTSIRFMHRVLFPHARKALPALVARTDDPAVQAALDEVARLAPGEDPLPRLLGWMDDDLKITPLKVLQGITWRDGYQSGLLRGELYPDVAPALQRWHAAGTRLSVYSSGSEEAQRLLFGYSDAGDLGGLFEHFFDTRVGLKRDPTSYAGIAGTIGLAPGQILFLSDVTAELDAAADSGFVVCHLVRPEDGAAAGTVHPVAADFDEVGRRFGLS